MTYLTQVKGVSIVCEISSTNYDCRISWSTFSVLVSYPLDDESADSSCSLLSLLDLFCQQNSEGNHPLLFPTLVTNSMTSLCPHFKLC